jgi:hypothetical protein
METDSIRKFVGPEVVAQWYSMSLVCTRPWVQSIAPKEKKNKKK